MLTFESFWPLWIVICGVGLIVAVLSIVYGMKKGVEPNMALLGGGTLGFGFGAICLVVSLLFKLFP
jgi:hypothetical protein